MITTCWLGSRTESVNTDFDGRPRRCRVVARVHNEHGDEVLLVEADPPLPGQDPNGLVTLRRRWGDDGWQDVATGSVNVFVGHVGADAAARLLAGGEQAVLRPSDVTPVDQGEIAATLELLPPTPEALWEEAFAVLEGFVAREGHARVPADHVEDGFNLGIWTTNMRLQQAHGYLTAQQAARLEALPGWEW